MTYFILIVFGSNIRSIFALPVLESKFSYKHISQINLKDYFYKLDPGNLRGALKGVN